MNIENQEVFYCADDGEYGVYCSICDKLCGNLLYLSNIIFFFNCTFESLLNIFLESSIL